MRVAPCLARSPDTETLTAGSVGGSNPTFGLPFALPLADPAGSAGTPGRQVGCEREGREAGELLQHLARFVSADGTLAVAGAASGETLHTLQMNGRLARDQRFVSG